MLGVTQGICHDRMFPEYRITIDFVNVGPLAVGSGKSSMTLLGDYNVDRIVLKERFVGLDGQVYEGPYIPGSSLKGAFRSLAEKLALATGMILNNIEVLVDGKVRYYSCTGEGLGETFNVVKKIVSQTRDCSWDPCDPSSCFNPNSDEEENRKGRNSSIKIEDINKCFINPVTLLFGSPVFKGLLSISDGIPVDPSLVSTRIRTRVAIDRITGSQYPGKLFTVEEVNPGNLWRVVLRLRGVDLESENEVSRLFKMLLNYICVNGLEVGGMSSVGAGRLEIARNNGKPRIVIEKIDIDINIGSISDVSLRPKDIGVCEA